MVSGYDTRTLIKRVLSEICMLKPLTSNKHSECEEYPFPLLPTVLLAARYLGQIFPMGIFTSEMDSDFAVHPNSGGKHCLKHLYAFISIHGVTSQSTEICSSHELSHYVKFTLEQALKGGSEGWLCSCFNFGDI
jgi:hypothetical protein